MCKGGNKTNVRVHWRKTAQLVGSNEKIKRERVCRKRVGPEHSIKETEVEDQQRNNNKNNKEQRKDSEGSRNGS